MTENSEGTVLNAEAGGTENAEASNEQAGNEQATQTRPEQSQDSPDSTAADKGTDNQETEQDADGDKSEKVGAPDEYEDFKAPEGVELDESLVGNFKEMAKELDLSQEQAQKLIDFQAEQAKKHETEVHEYYDNLMSEWQKAVKTDSEIGGKAFDDSVAHAKAALDAFGTPELKEALETTGMGNHPEFVRVFARMGKAIKEDGFRVGASNPSGPKDPASVLFPNQK